MNMRKLLGTRNRHHLAVEEFDTENPAPVSAEDATVVMKGPLADVYSDALAKVYDKANDPAIAEDPATNPEAKPDPATGQPDEIKPTDEVEVDTSNIVPKEGETAETVEAAIVSEVGSIVLESQAIDAAVTQSLAAALSDEAPSDGSSYETMYAIDETQVTPTDVKDVTALLAEADAPENVTVMIDNVVTGSMADLDCPQAMETKELAVALESMVVAMGGNVVRGFPAYVASRKR